jgi:hypothetical protein
MGALTPGTDISINDERFLLIQVLYTTHDRIHGLLHYEGATQLFFVGYKCGKCDQVFLVPDTVHDDPTLAGSLRHYCMESPDKTGTYRAIERGNYEALVRVSTTRAPKEGLDGRE